MSPELIPLLTSAVSVLIGAAGEKLWGADTQGSALKSLATGLGSVWPSLLSTKVERATDARALEQRRLRNHDLHELAGRAIRLVFDELERDLVNKKALRADLRTVRDCFDKQWSDISIAAVPSDIADAATTLAEGSAAQPGASRLGTEGWRQFFVRLSGLPPERHQVLFARLGDAMHARYERALWEVVARSWKERDCAWPKLLLGMVGDLAKSTAATGRETQELEASYRRLSSDLTHYLDTVTPSLADYLHRPWEVPNTFPYHFSQRQTTIVGAGAREAFAQLDGFLSDARDFSWWLWTGLEGAGKSRCAAELCRLVERRAWGENGRWRAGFLEAGDLTRLSDSWQTVSVDAPTLLVLDYIASAIDDVRQALVGLASRDHATPLRVLLLERHSEPLSAGPARSLRPEWVDRIFWPELDRRASEEIAKGQYPEPGAMSLHLGGLDRTAATELATQVLERESPHCPPEVAGEVIDAMLRMLGEAPRPLHVQITAVVLSQKRDDRPATFPDVMREYLGGRLAHRRRQLASVFGTNDETDRILNLLCVATLLRQVSLETIGELLDQHPPWHWRLPSRTVLSRTATLKMAFGQPPVGPQLNGLEPDLIGEWFVRLWCDDGAPDRTLDSGTLAEIAQAIPGSSPGIEDFVQRTYRYFNDTALWRVLRNTLGRYSTPFGRAFDQRQAKLLGGTTGEADEAYGDAIHQHIEATIETSRDGDAVVIDLMAGGSSRPADLLHRYADDVTLIAIDRDVSRLSELPVTGRDPGEPGLRVVQAEVLGRLDLRRVLDEACGREQCDLVVAKKALHELPWVEQEGLIRRIGEVVRPGGHVIVYADSPECMDQQGRRFWRKLDRRLHELLPIDLPASEDLEERARALLPVAVAFDPEAAWAPAVFANLWIRLKDWANYNRLEYLRRYFSSTNELLEVFGQAGFETSLSTEAHGASWMRRFEMELQASRFVEEAINRLGYLAVDPATPPEELTAVFARNPRYQLFWSVTSAYLWSNDAPTAFGARDDVRATAPCRFALEDLLEFVGNDALTARLRRVDLPPLASPSFHMPVHVLMLGKT